MRTAEVAYLGFLEGTGISILPEPEALLTATPKVPGLDGRKMSKSYGNTIGLREDTDSIVKKLKAMQTDPARARRSDPGDPDKCPVWDLHKIYSSAETKDWVQKGCRSAGIGCLECKAPLIEKIVEEVSGIAKRACKSSKRIRIWYAVLSPRGASGRGQRWHARDHGCRPTSYGDELPMKPELTLVQNAAVPQPVPSPGMPAPAQSEMPFAVVEGQPILELPREVFIPPQALEVVLEACEGPLDMLLYLIRRQNLDILDIPIAEITRQYMRYIELMQVLQLER